ncbi:hypothetical protein MPOR_19630 [Mycolicibacterium poriferae]|uniref:Uncharacterized protein n=1 Tax=Mycolicibacterium poriferae TaxID=39694 RepID=A0A6N4VB71_9MYCO|nr:hypothetical protein MPOR_19630 [Mycolicibacterium poriferae]
MAEYAQIARHAPGWDLGSQIGSAQLGGVDLDVAVPRGHSVDNLPVGEHITVPVEMRFQVPGRLGNAGSDDERQLGRIEGCEVGLRQHAGISSDHQGRVIEVVAGQEAGDDRHDGAGLGGVAFETAALQRESGAVHQQPAHDLWVDTTRLRVADLAQRILRFGFETQGRHVVQDQRQPAAIGGVGEAFFGDHVAVTASVDLADVAVDGLIRHPRGAEISQHPRSIELAGRLHDPGDHQIAKYRIADGIEAQQVIDVAKGVVKQTRAGPDRAPWWHHRGRHRGPRELGDQRPLTEISDVSH